MEPLQQDHLAQIDVQLDDDARQSLYQTGRWTLFISWIIFIGAFLSILFIIVSYDTLSLTLRGLDTMGDLFQESSSALFIILTLGILFVVFLYFFLFRFSRKTQQALRTESPEQLHAGISSLKIYFIISTVISTLVLIYNIYTFIVKLINN